METTRRYGGEHTFDENLQRFRSRAIAAKRAFALRESSLGIEPLERHVRMERLSRLQERVFGILADLSGIDRDSLVPVTHVYLSGLPGLGPHSGRAAGRACSIA
jgi:hypothetical protein